jgi:superfamily I DNA/RNA helicase
MESLATRLNPTAADNIEFIGVHALASWLLREGYGELNLNPRATDEAFATAWRRTDAERKLGRLDPRPSYWREEIDYVVKGRALDDFDTYRHLNRLGRKTQLRESSRQDVWDLYRAYEEELQERGVADFNDLLIKAYEVAEVYADVGLYSHVVVDEVQDLNLVAMRLLARLAGEGPNSLLIVGDGQQAVYPGGFGLPEAGIDVRGRSTVLKVNYRNTEQILTTAAAAVSLDEFDDLDGIAQPGLRDTSVVRTGHPPRIIDATSTAALDRQLIEQITATRAFASHIAWGDMAVLALRNKDVEHYRRILANANIPTIELTQYDGVATDHVKVGTFKRAKGLEFKYVLLPGLSREAPAIWDGETPEAYDERCARQRREEYVGMTRARDGLWLGYLSP